MIAGEFEDNRATQEIRFPAKTGRYVRLVPLSKIDGNPWTSIAELQVFGFSFLGNLPPESSIVSPSGYRVILLGDNISFSGLGSDADGNAPLGYAWDFDGAAPNSNQQNPGSVTFSTAGTYTVMLTVTDSKGHPDDSPATVVVKVLDIGGAVSIPRQTGQSFMLTARKLPARTVCRECHRWQNGLPVESAIHTGCCCEYYHPGI